MGVGTWWGNRATLDAVRATKGGKGMRINCLSCGHKLDMGDDYDDYEGLVKCFICGALLKIRAEEGRLKSVDFLKTVRGSIFKDVVEQGR
jgi:transcription elongation factor Elf1